MNFLKSIWTFLDGKKTILCSLAGVALSWAEATGHVSAVNATYLASGLSAATGLAIGHKVVKAASDAKDEASPAP